jgi:hypothetical protein
MKKKIITLQGLKEVLSNGELKRVLGGGSDAFQCYWCAAGDTGICYSDECTDFLSSRCPGGWMQWSC